MGHWYVSVGCSFGVGVRGTQLAYQRPDGLRAARASFCVSNLQELAPAAFVAGVAARRRVREKNSMGTTRATLSCPAGRGGALSPSSPPRPRPRGHFARDFFPL